MKARNRPWTTQELVYVRIYYPTLGSAIAVDLGRSPKAVKMCACRHGIRANRAKIARAREREKRADQ